MTNHLITAQYRTSPTPIISHKYARKLLYFSKDGLFTVIIWFTALFSLSYSSIVKSFIRPDQACPGNPKTTVPALLSDLV